MCVFSCCLMVLVGAKEEIWGFFAVKAGVEVVAGVGGRGWRLGFGVPFARKLLSLSEWGILLDRRQMSLSCCAPRRKFCPLFNKEGFKVGLCRICLELQGKGDKRRLSLTFEVPQPYFASPVSMGPSWLPRLLVSTL